MEERLKKFYDLVSDIAVAMLTTRRPDGLLVSRPMATQARATGADLWFVTAEGSPKLDELAHDGNVNLAFYKDRTREWISVAGRGRIVRDRAKIHELYRPDWRAWFEEAGDERHGTPDDPRMVLIAVDIEIAHFMEVNKPQVVVLFELVKGLITKKHPDVGEMHTIER